MKQSTHDEKAEEIPFDDKDPAVDWNGPMVVLTSRISASASEIVAGTLKDYQRAVIVGGDHTFGKGSVQSVVPHCLQVRGPSKSTVGMFFTPGGFSTQHRGVEGDVVLPGAFSTDDIGEKFLDYSLPPKHIKPFLSSEAYVTTGTDAWKKVDKDTIDYLRGLSEKRVAKNEEFQKIKEDLKKAKERGKVVKLSEALKDSKDKKDKTDKKRDSNHDEKVAEYVKRADVQEAANVAADLIEAMDKPNIILGQHTKAKSSAPTGSAARKEPAPRIKTKGPMAGKLATVTLAAQAALFVLQHIFDKSLPPLRKP